VATESYNKRNAQGYSIVSGKVAAKDWQIID
jgi:hypothetical protein